MTRSDSEFGRLHPSVLEAHHTNGVSAADIQRAYVRFTWARRKAPVPFAVLRWLSAGVAIGLGVASAATLVPRPQVHSDAPAEKTQMGASSARHRVQRQARNTIREEPALVQMPAASSEPSNASAPVSSSSSNSALDVAPLQTRVPATPESTAKASVWQIAAAALRRGDVSAAEAALTQIEKSDSARDRDAAALAKAQLLVASGRAAEATASLRRLARDGNSETIRAQAASMLQNSADQQLLPLVPPPSSHP